MEADVVEDEELALRTEVGGVGQTGAGQVLLGLAGYVAGVAAVALAGQRVEHVAVEVERLVLAERVENRRVGVGHEDHVRLLDLLEASDRRAVEAEALRELFLVELADRHREVLHQAGEVTEPQVHHLDSLALGEGKHVSGSPLFHDFSFSGSPAPVPGQGVPGDVAGRSTP